MTINIVKGDITERRADAVVNSANPSLLAGGGVCGAIYRAAGPDLEAACRRLGRCEPGCAVITPAFRLDARFVIHAVGPLWFDGSRGEPDLLERCYESVFRIAQENAVSSLAIPSISTGIYRYPLEQATEIAVDVAKRYNAPDLLIEFVCFDDATSHAYLRRYPPGMGKHLEP